VPSGSITGGAWAKAKDAGKHLEDILSSVTGCGAYFGEVSGEYRDAIMEHLPEIIGITAAFIAAEALSAFLAATPTGVGQLAAAVIQLGLAAFGAKAFVDAGGQALSHASDWLTTAWTANGDPKKLAAASKSFLKMLVSIAMAALALLGARGNTGKGLKLADGVTITPPSIRMMPAMTPGGATVGVPVFQPGSITAAPTVVGGSGATLMTGAGVGSSKANVGRGKTLTPEQQKRVDELERKILELEAGTEEHQAARWELYQLTGGEWSFERWLNTYKANMTKANISNEGVAAYQARLGWGETEVTVRVGGTTRRLDIADLATKRGVEIKQYKEGYISLNDDIRSEIARDKMLVAEDWEITWIFIKTKPSQPLLDLLGSGIKVKYE
jgi:hypothetical protein